MALTKIAAVLLVVGLVVGVVAGYGLSFTTYQPQVSQLQSDLSEARSDLTKAQSDLSTTLSKLTATEANLTKAQATITSLDSKLKELEANYTALSSEHNKFKSNVTSLSNSLKKKLDLEAQFIHILTHALRNETTEVASAFLGFEPYVDAVGDAELSTLLDEAYTFLAQGKSTEFTAKFTDLLERNSALIESDLSNLDTLLAS